MFPCSFFARPMGWGQSKWVYFVHSPKLLETVLYKTIEVTTWHIVNVVHILALSVQFKLQDSAVSDVLSFCWWAGIAAQTLHCYLSFSGLNTRWNNFCALCFVSFIHLKVLLDNNSSQCLCVLAVSRRRCASHGWAVPQHRDCPQAWGCKSFSSEEQLCWIKRCRCPYNTQSVVERCAWGKTLNHIYHLWNKWQVLTPIFNLLEKQAQGECTKEEHWSSCACTYKSSFDARVNIFAFN